MFGLKEDTINKINSVFKKYEEIEKVILYGSRAKGNYQIGSDIDLTIIDNNLSFSRLMKIETELDDLLLPYKIDLSKLSDISNADLLEHIKRIGVVFFEKL
jgi:predicted nucleotidyltransferase